MPDTIIFLTIAACAPTCAAKYFVYDLTNPTLCDKIFWIIIIGKYAFLPEMGHL